MRRRDDRQWTISAHTITAITRPAATSTQVTLPPCPPPQTQGPWSIPWGFAGTDETPDAAARQECLEEAGVRGTIDGLLSVQALPGTHPLTFVHPHPARSARLRLAPELEEPRRWGPPLPVHPG
ncbi:NUDIX domain-containing protein [Thermasporomyces composti]|uniref:NUDIX domain-containing protein n=1 Tax=Thermasporomyces composti TaxID=696763 RepID=UPI001475DD97